MNQPHRAQGSDAGAHCRDQLVPDSLPHQPSELFPHSPKAELELSKGARPERRLLSPRGVGLGQPLTWALRGQSKKGVEEKNVC